MRNQPVSNPENPHLLLEYLHVFGHLFFFNTIKDICYIQVVRSLPSGYGDFIGHAIKGFGECDPTFEGRIRILERRGTAPSPHDPLHDYQKSPQNRLHDCLGTLHHEMLHAMFALYTRRSCPSYSDRFAESIGLGGHKHAWAGTARFIEDCTGLLPKGRLNVRIKSSIELKGN
jgi:hypothetical protein